MSTQSIQEGFLSNISRANRFKNIRDLRAKRDAYRNFTSPEGFKLNFQADMANTGAQALRKNQNASLAMNQFQNDTRMYQPKYLNDSYNRMSYGGIQTAEQMALDNYKHRPLKEHTMIIPIKDIILEQGGLTPQQKLQIAGGIATGVVGGSAAFQLYDTIGKNHFAGSLPTNQFSNYNLAPAPGADHKFLAYEDAKINLDSDQNREEIIQHLKNGLNNLNVPQAFYQNNNGNTLLNTYKDQGFLDSFK